MSESPDQENKDSAEDKKSKLGFLSVLQSVIAAMFGVQSEEKRQLDFEKGNAADYIFVGIIMVVVFVLSIIWYVNSVIADYAAG